MADEPWYKDGLKFKCTQCGDCCTGAPGYVWVNQAEVEGIAAELGETAQGSDHYQALFTLGIFLFLVTFVINLTADIVVRGRGKGEG